MLTLSTVLAYFITRYLVANKDSNNQTSFKKNITTCILHIVISSLFLLTILLQSKGDMLDLIYLIIVLILSHIAFACSNYSIHKLAEYRVKNKLQQLHTDYESNIELCSSYKHSLNYILQTTIHLIILIGFTQLFSHTLSLNEVVTYSFFSFYFVYSFLLFILLLTYISGEFISHLFTILEFDSKIKNSSLENSDHMITMKYKEDDTLESKTVQYEEIANNEIQNYGRYIGYFERIIISFALVTGYPAGIAVLATIKTFSRYKQLSSKRFTEEFILGTLSSVSFALIITYIFTTIVIRIF